MPTERAAKKARKAAKAGKSASTQAGAFVEEEMHKLKHGGGRAKSRKQAIAIGLSEARREGVKLAAPKKATAATKKKAKKDSTRGAAKRASTKRPSTKRASRKRASK